MNTTGTKRASLLSSQNRLHTGAAAAAVRGDHARPQELIVTWNTGRNGDQQPAVPFLALQEQFSDYLSEKLI